MARAIFGLPVRGWVPITSAAVDVDETGAPRSVRAQLDLASIDTGNPRRDRDLRKPKLLDLDQHPRLTFVAGAPIPVDGGWTATGTLTARGTQVPITLRVAVTGSGDDLVVTATGVLDRSTLGMRVPRFVIGLRVRFHVVATFVAPA